MEQNDKLIWQARASLCELLALSFRYPDTVLAGAVASGEWLAAAAEICATLGLAEPDAASLAPYEGEGPDKVLHRLRVEATHLFVGAPEPACSPFEGVWRAADDGVQALLFVNPHSMDVERFCKSCGLGRPEGTNEPIDHVATECELLQYLASLAAGIAEPVGKVALDEFPGGSAAAAFEQFVKEHLSSWVPKFADAVIAESREPFYKATVLLLKEAARIQ